MNANTHLSARLTPDQAAALAGRATITIYRALEAGLLHGTQQTTRGRWSIRPECLDAWLDGDKCTHQDGTQKIVHLKIAN